MKFVKSFLTILVASSTLALTIPTKREESLDMECQQALTKYSFENQDCKNEISSIKNEDELKKHCEKMTSAKNSIPLVLLLFQNVRNLIKHN